jgi:YD repeat-containing protein
MKSTMSQLLKWWTLVTVVMLAAQPVTAKKPKDEAGSHNCELYPVALSLSSVSNIATGTVLSNLRNGTQRGEFGWVTWTGNRSRDSLVKSLTDPGDSHTYINPMNRQREPMDTRSWVRATGSDKGKNLQQALDRLKQRDIVVPLWYQALGKEERAAYRIAGFAKVRLLSYDLARQDTISVQYLGMVNCNKGNDAPVVSAGDDQVIAYPARASLNGSVIDDGLPANKELATTWSKVSGPGEVIFTDPLAVATMASFSEPGTYLLRLSASDGAKSASDEVVVTVNYANAAPVANSQTLSTAEDVAVNVNLTGQDVDGDPITFTVLSNPSFGVLSGTAPNLVYTPAPNLSGSDSFTFKVNDGVLDSAAATVMIDVTPVNDPPVAYGQSVSTDEDTPLSVALGGDDAEGTALVFTVVDPPAHGVLSGTPPNMLYTPAANHFGSDQFTFQVDDGALSSAPATVTITVRSVNDAPIAQADLVALTEDGAADVTLRGSDVEGSALTFSIVTPPAHGALTGTPPALRYVPAANYNGEDSFTFKVNDGALDSASAVVTLSVEEVNDAPVALNDSVALDEDSGADIVLRGSDIEGSVLTFMIVNAPAHGVLSGTPPNVRYVPTANYNGADNFSFVVNDSSLDSAPATVSLTIREVNDAPLAADTQVSLNEDVAVDLVLTGSDVEGSPLSFSVVDAPAHGALIGTPPNLRYVPNANYHGPDAFTFRVNDGELDSALATASLTVASVNDEPTASSQDLTTPEDTPLAITLTASDIDGDPLTYELISLPHGTLSGTPPNLIYTPNANYNGSDHFHFRVDDGMSQSALATISLTVTPVNDPPVANAQSVSTLEDNSRSVTLTGSDVDDNGLTFTVTVQPAHGVLSGTAPNLLYIPHANHNGSDSFVFTANDGSVNSDPAVVSITVTPVNDPPVAHGQDLRAVELESTPITLSGSDVDDDALTFEIVSGPANGTLSGTAPNLSYTPNTAGRPETDSFTFAVSDGVVSSTLATVTIDIIYNQPPVVSAGPDRVVRSSGEMITLTGSATDDGLPRNSSLQLAWQMKFGPGTVTFGDASSAVTTATFSADGLYVLELSGTDSQYTSSDLMEVRVAMICSANPSGAVVWWPANFNGADVIAGNQAQSATYGAGKVGAGFVFDGVDDQVRIEPSPSLDLGAANSFTIEFWMNSADVSRSVRLLGWHSGLDVFPDDQGVNIFQSGGALHAQLYDVNNAPHEMVAFSSLANNAWTHIAVTYDRNAGQGRIYVNGALRTTSNLGSFRPRTTFPLFLGNILSDVGYFEGALDEVTFYTRTLDAQEIHEIYAANGTGKCPLSPNLPPAVNAGPDVYLEDTGVATLNGSATDDGLPAPASLRAAWSVVSGPGTVTFNDSAALSTAAGFDAHGIYVLRLSVDDGEIVRSDVMEVRVASVCTIKNLPGLAAWFPGNGSANDVIGGRQGRLGGGTSFANGRVGGAFSFDGVNDSLRIPGDSGLDVGTGSGFSIELWVNSADTARNGRFLVYHNGLAANGTNVGVNIFQLAGNVHTQIPEIGGTVREFVANGVLIANNWTHVVVTYDRSRGLARTYINGAQRVLANVGSYVARTVGNVHLGNLPFDVNHFRGLLDEVSIYNRALDGQEVYELFAAGSTGKCPNDGNQRPIVNAGPDLHLRDVTQVATLNGTVTDDGLPPGYAVRSLWSVVNGPGAVTFGDITATATTATFSAPGIYVLRLTADDALIASSDLVEVRVGTLCTVKDPAGLVSWWPGNGNASDVAGVNNARLAGGVSFANGRVSSAFRFDGSNDVVQVPAHPTLDVGQGNGLTLEFWVNSTDVIRFTRMVGFHLGVGAVSTNFGVNVYQQSGSVSAQIYDLAGVPHEMGAANSLVSNVWTHVAVTYDRTAGQGRIYINGALRTTSSLGVYTPRTSYSLFFGNLPSDSGFFRGMLDEVSLYSRPLDAQEVYDIYNSGTAGKCPKDQNSAPVVNAGPNLELAAVTDVATLNGTVTDDGLPTGAGLRMNWSKLDGPGTVTFGDASAAATSASFSAPGIYVLSLTADDAAIVRNDLLEVRVAVSCSAAAAGLVAWWPGNGDATDVIAANNGRLAGGTVFNSGRVSAAFRFDGTNDSVHIPAHPSLDVGLGTGLTLEFWVNPTDVTRNGRMVGWHSGLGSASTNFGVNVQMLGRTVNAQIYDLAGLSHDVSVANILTNNTWTHVAVTYDRAASQGRVYINGMPRNTVTVGSYTPRTSYKLFFGNVPFDPNFFRGMLDEVSIYDHALTSNEVAAVFAAGATGKCPPAPVGPMSLQELAASESMPTITENESGQRIGMTDASGSTTYAYDAAGRVTRINKSWSAHAGAPAIETSLVYEYDQLGRFVGVHSISANGASMGYVWSDANHLLEVVDPHVGSTVYHYDGAGKAISYTYPDGVTGSRFGVLDNVACHDEPGATMVCDADGNRVRRTITVGSRTVTTYYVVSPLTVTGAAQVVEELTFDSSDPLFATPAVTRVYVHGFHTISKEELVNGDWQLSFFE